MDYRGNKRKIRSNFNSNVNTQKLASSDDVETVIDTMPYIKIIVSTKQKCYEY